MGERKGQNKYYPPDFNYKKHGNLNRYHGVHALRERAAKLSQGILIIRFEMPFNIWCLGCHNHVGMGVRYNAEKKKVGMYYTTPIFEFRMKCHLCDNYYVIRTDPKNFDYELVEGCSRQEKRWDPSTINQLGAVDRSFNQKLAADSMFKLEHEDQDKKKKESVAKDVENLEWLQERMRDDYAANSALRREFRKQRKELNEQRAKDEALRKRGSMSIKLVPEDPEDQRVASMVTRYRAVKTFEERQEETRANIEARPILSSPGPSSSTASSSKEKLQQRLVVQRSKRLNDCFDAKAPALPEKKLVLGIVRRRVVKKEENEEEEEEEPVESGPLFSTFGVKKEDEGEEPKPSCSRSLVAEYSDSSEEDSG